MATSTPLYEQTRQAWRDIWEGTEFDRELRTLDYARSQELLNAYVPLLDKSLPIIEAGCGPAHVVYYLRQRGYNVIGIDYAPEALKPTLLRFPALPLHMGDIHNLPYPTNSFGAYLSFGVVEHFEHGPLPALKEAFRILAPNGVLVITVPHPQFVDSLVTLANRVLPNRSAQPRAEYYERTYRHEELAGFVQQAGFALDRVIPMSHAYTFYGLHPAFRQANGYYETSPLAESAGAFSRRWLPWITAFHTLILAHKPVTR